MKRKIRQIFSIEGLRHIKYLFIIPFVIKNWLPFILNYTGLKNSIEIYHLRKGLNIETFQPIDVATIAIIFIRKDYGNIPKNESTIIDIGANIGVFSLFAASKSKKAKIYSYEPIPETYKKLIKNIKNNNILNIYPRNFGVCSKNENRTFFIGSDSIFTSLYSKNEGQEIKVKCVSLKKIFDDEKIENCDLLKIDCEGAEFEILYSTPKEVFEKIKEIRMEYHLIDKTHNINDLVKFMRKHKFDVIRYKKDIYKSGNIWFKKIKV